MSALSARRDGGWVCTVRLLERARELDVDFGFDRFSMLVYRIECLRYVDYVEDRHQFWARIDPETSNPVTAERRVEVVLAKIERLLLQYRRRA